MSTMHSRVLLAARSPPALGLRRDPEHSERAPVDRSALRSTVPSYVTEPFTHEQQLVQQGARLVIADGRSACHLAESKRSIAPSLASFAIS